MKSLLLWIAAIVVIAFLTSGFLHAGRGGLDDYVSGEINVVLRSGASIDAVNALYGTTLIDRIPGTSYYRLRMPGGRTDLADDALTAADRNFVYEHPEIRQASQAFLDQASQAFVDGSQPASFFAQPSVANLRLFEAHTISKGAGVTIAVIDTGIDFDHPLFAGRIAPDYYDFVDNDFNPADEPNGMGTGHGTFVAGLIALAAPEARIMPLRAFGPDGRATSFNIAKAIRFATDKGATVINMSFGLMATDSLIKDAIGYASSSAYLISAAGNDDLDILQFPGLLASKVCSVASTTDSDRKAPFSNYNKDVDISAPGVSLYSAYPGGRWAYWTGTSFSAALVSAAAAQALALNPEQDRSDLDKIMQESGVVIDHLNVSFKEKLGRRLDYFSAVKSVER